LEELLRKSLVSYEFSAPSVSVRLAGDLEINIFRIAQELVNNIVKHAEAQHVVVHFSQQYNVITLSFGDDGKGFKNGAQQNGVGLTNIYTRAELIGGTVEIQSSPGKGTFVQLTILL
jgi:signal transduction histidine kinase